MRAFDPRLKAFAHVNAEKAPLYRAVMGIFVAAKSRFVLHLRPREIAAALADAGSRQTESPIPLEEGELDFALAQLCEWGNLEAHPDTTDVTTVEDFYRKRFLYQLTAAGEAAERALALFWETIHQPGELKTAALADIHALLEELLHLARAEALDDGKVHRTLLALCHRFDELTAKAQAFIGSLQRTIDLQGIEVDDLLAYKEMLIDYLERFIGELVMATRNIAATLRRIEGCDLERLLSVAARRDLADALETSAAERDAAERGWHERWHGLASWFVAEGRASQAEILRARARSAIPALLAAVAGLHDRRVSRSDRTTDLRTLGRWFAQADSDRDAHRLWRAAFGLAPARHLAVDQATLEARDARPVSPQTSWLEAPPLVISPRLRKSGRYVRRGGPRKVIGRRHEKRLLAEFAAAEAEQVAAARERLASGQPMRLSQLGVLDDGQFRLFLDLLGEALAARVGSGAAEATSSDGALHVALAPTGDGVTAIVETRAGRFCGDDHWITVREVGSETAAAVPVAALAAELDEAVEATRPEATV